MAGRSAGSIEARGKNKWLVRVDFGVGPDGKRNRPSEIVTGSKKDAQAVLNKLLRDKDQGLLLESSRETLDIYLDRWLESAAKPRLGMSSYGDYERLLKYYIRPSLGKVPLNKITTLSIQKVYTGMQARGLSPRTIQYTHRVFRNALEQAVKWRILVLNPAQHVELPRQERREMQYLSDTESRRFLKAAQDSPHFALFALMLATGLRPSEALALRWQDIDLERHAVRITRTVKRTKGMWLFDEPKTKKSRRVVDYPGSLNEVLLKHRLEFSVFGEVTELVFANFEGQPLHETNILKRHYRPLLLAAGLPDTMRLYDLRHTHATLLLLQGTHPKVVSEGLGHSSIVITLDTYSHMIPSMQRESADKLDALLFKASDEETDEAKPPN